MTNSSFGSTCSSPIAVANCDEKGLNLLRVPSPASFESDYSVKLEFPKGQEPLIQVGPEKSSETPVFDPILDMAEGTKHQHDEEIAYSKIFKSQPSPPILASHYLKITNATTTFLEPSVQAK